MCFYLNPEVFLLLFFLLLPPTGVREGGWVNCCVVLSCLPWGTHKKQLNNNFDCRNCNCKTEWTLLTLIWSCALLWAQQYKASWGTGINAFFSRDGEVGLHWTLWTSSFRNSGHIMMVGWNFSAGLISLDKAQFHCSVSIILTLCGWLYIHHSPCIPPDLQAPQFCNIFIFPVCSEPDFHNAPQFFVSRPDYDLFFLIFFNHIIFQWGNSGLVCMVVMFSVFTTCKQCTVWHGLLWSEKSG